VFKRGEAPLFVFSLSKEKERGTKGVRQVNNPLIMLK